ncbi:MAG: AmmeMemoRadiSam system protein A [bacterium]
MAIVYGMCVPHPPLIIPAVGRGSEKQITKTIESYHQVMKKAAAYHPDTVVIISPHSVMYADYIHISPGRHARGDFGRFRAKSVNIEVEYDQKFSRELTHLCAQESIEAGTMYERDKELDHGTMIPLYFLQQYTRDFQVVRIGISDLGPLTHYHFGQCIAQTAEKLNRRVVLIASGDLSHKLQTYGPYGYVEEGPQFDKLTTQAFADGDFKALLTMNEAFCDKAAECGLRGFQMLAGAFDGLKVKSNLYSYEDITGVGYGVADFIPLERDDSRCFGKQLLQERLAALEEERQKQDPYAALARQTIERYIGEGLMTSVPDDLPDDMRRPAGVFVSLKIAGKLRGCIGTFKPTTDSIAQEIIQNAISAATRDPRFPSVTKEELKWLSYSVDVLGEVEPVSDISELDVKRYGVIVSAGRKRGLLLPDLEGVDTVEDQIEIARQKAHINENVPLTLERFEVVRHK